MRLQSFLERHLRVVVLAGHWKRQRHIVVRHIASAIRAQATARVKSAARALLPKVVELRLRAKSWRRSDRVAWPLPDHGGFTSFEYSLFSQNGEDGILRHIFSEIEFTSRRFLEFGFGVTENNSLRLVLHERFGGVFIDGNPYQVRAFNETARQMRLSGVQALHRFLTVDNLEPTIRNAGVPDEIDLLSIDVDGNDLWFWKQLGAVRSRVVVIEYNASLGPALALTTPYDPQFVRYAKETSGFYGGASLEALCRIGRKKGYALVACDSTGTNAIFLRTDCLTHSLAELTPAQAFRPHRGRLAAGFSLEEQLDLIVGLPHVSID